MSQPREVLEMGTPAGDELPPRHGFQGDRGAAQTLSAGPRGLSIALSREAGARGGTIARRVGQKLGWQVYDQELLEYMAQDTVVRQGVIEGLAPADANWLEACLGELRRESNLADDAGVENLARLVLALAVQGEAVLIGRGAGCILPRQTTLNVRIVAPLPERIAYMGQWLRLPLADATEKVRLRDERRAEFLSAHFGKSVGDVYQYDMVLSSSSLGEDGCADLIAQAAHIRLTAMVEGRRG